MRVGLKLRERVVEQSGRFDPPVAGPQDVAQELAAGGIRSKREVRALERMGMNAAVGMALYLDRLR